MPFNGTGTFVRLENWTNDANANLPISATKFDIEDNDFASGFGLCLTRDGQGTPSGPLTWTQRLNLNIAADTVGLQVARTGGANNPAFQVTAVDGTGVNLNLSTSQTLALAVAGVAVLSIAAALITAAQPIKLPNGAVNAPALTFANQVTDGFYSIAAGDIGLAIAGVKAGDFSAGQIAAVAPGAAAAALIAAGNGLSLANGLQIAVSAAGVGQINFGGSTRATISSAGVWTFNAPSAGTTLNVSGLSNSPLAILTAGATSAQAFGVRLRAGTTAADWALLVRDQTDSTNFFEIMGTGEVFTAEPATASAIPAGTHQVGYADMPPNTQTAAYQLVLSDRGKMIFLNTTGGVTIPANASVAFPIGSTVLVYNATGASQTISITTDTLTFLPANTGGTRTLANASIATLWKAGTNSWRIWGFGIT